MGSLTQSGAVREIASQAELELGRQLTTEEELNIFQRFSPQAIVDNIEKVNKNNVTDRNLQIFCFSMALDFLSFCTYSARNLSSNVKSPRMLLQGMVTVFFMVGYIKEHEL